MKRKERWLVKKMEGYTEGRKWIQLMTGWPGGEVRAEGIAKEWREEEWKIKVCGRRVEGG